MRKPPEQVAKLMKPLIDKLELQPPTYTILSTCGEGPGVCEAHKNHPENCSRTHDILWESVVGRLKELTAQNSENAYFVGTVQVTALATNTHDSLEGKLYPPTIERG